MSRPILRTNGIPSIYAGINIDFSTANSTLPLSFAPSSSAIWDSGVWDSSLWGGPLSILQNWQGLNGVGYYGAPVVKVASNSIDVTWVATDIVIEGGGIL
jgi:hypothetical protein